MTSKLWHTLVGFGIALGMGPACLGRSHAGAGDGPLEEPGEDAGQALGPDVGPVDSGPADAFADVADASLDPFCDVSWPPTKANPYPPRTPCFDPHGECTGAHPIACFPTLGPSQCATSPNGEWDPNFGREGPLICVDGEWRCPPGTLASRDCRCWGETTPGRICTDAGWMDSGGGSGGAP